MSVLDIPSVHKSTESNVYDLLCVGHYINTNVTWARLKDICHGKDSVLHSGYKRLTDFCKPEYDKTETHFDRYSFDPHNGVMIPWDKFYEYAKEHNYNYMIDGNKPHKL